MSLFLSSLLSEYHILKTHAEPWTVQLHKSLFIQLNGSIIIHIIIIIQQLDYSKGLKFPLQKV